MSSARELQYDVSITRKKIVYNNKKNYVAN